MKKRRPDFNASLTGPSKRCGQIGHLLKGLDIIGPTIGIAGKIHRIHTDENMPGLAHLCKSKGIRQEDRIAGRHIGNGDACIHFLGRAPFGNIDIRCQRTAAKQRQINMRDFMFHHIKAFRHPVSGLQLGFVALSIIEGQRMKRKTIGARHGTNGCRIQAARKQQDRRGGYCIVCHGRSVSHAGSAIKRHRHQHGNPAPVPSL